MAVTTVRPNATASGTALFTISGGSATLDAALSDNSDATFISKTTSVVGQASAILDFGTTTITSSQRVKQVRIRARCLTPTSSGKLNIYLGTRADNQNYFHSALAVRGQNAAATTFTGPYYSSAPNGSSWTQATVNGLRAKITEYTETSNIGNFYELYIDVDISTKPSVTVSAPTGTITTTTAPDVTWTYTDTDNETQAFYQIKVFTSAVYGGGGFSADTSTATWDSGEIASSDSSAVVNALLSPDTYRAYVRVAKSINGEPFWSDWAFSNFVISYTAPTIPTLVATWNSSLGRASFVLTGAVPTGYSSQYYQVQRSDDSGLNYYYVRNAETITPNVSYVGSAVDYEAPRGLTAYYRCRSVGVDANDNEYPSAWGTVQQILITNDATWWFKAVTEPTINKGSIRILRELDVQKDEPNIVFRPLGADKPKVVAGPIQGEDGGYTIKTVNQTEWDNLLPLLDYQGIILSQNPYGYQKYIRITSRGWTEENQGGVIHRDVNVRYVEVDA